MFFTSETIIKKFEGKLSGQYSWPFLLAFPKEVIIRGQHQYLSKTYPTPRSFLDSGTNISVQYDLVLRITHGMLRADSKCVFDVFVIILLNQFEMYRLNVEVIYVPDSTPDPFSLLCEAAYSRNATTPGPEEDPDGWFTLSHANIHGKLCFTGRHAHLRCTVSQSYFYGMLGSSINSPYSFLLPNRCIFFLSLHTKLSTDPIYLAMLLSWGGDPLSSQHPQQNY